MESAQLGKSGITIPRLCIGSWQAYGWQSTDENRFIQTVQHAIDKGITFIDTAPNYGKGYAEMLVGRAIAGRRDKVVLATKFLCPSLKEIRESLEISLTLLKTDYLDLLQQHWPTQNIPAEEVIALMEKFKQEGKIRALGVSNWLEPQWDAVKDPRRIDSLQPCYNLLWRSIEPRVLPLCRKNSISILTYSSLCQGLLTGKLTNHNLPKDFRQYNQRFKKEQVPQVSKVLGILKEIAERYHKTMAQTALRWLLDQPGVTAVIVGASRPEQVNENLGALDWKLEPQDCQRLSEISWPLSAELKPEDNMWGFKQKF